MKTTHWIGPWEHWKWVVGFMRHHFPTVYIAEVNGVPVGTAQIADRRWNAAERGFASSLSITVAPACRSRGYATPIIEAVCKCEWGPFLAEVRADNMASRRAFTRAGFTTKDVVQDWVIMERAC